MQTHTWKLSAPGVWRLTIKEPQGITPLSWMGVAPREEALQQMSQVLPPFAWDSVQLEEVGGSLILSFPLNQTEKLYGTGLQLLRMNQRGRTRYLRVNSDPKQDTGETHAPVPFYVSDLGYGVWVDTSRIVTMHLGSTLKKEDTRQDGIRDRNTDRSWRATPIASRVEIRLPSEGADIYLFGGPTLSDVVARYNLFCGGGVLPPKWGLGFWHRVPTLYNEEQVLEEAEQFRLHDMPCDVIGLEPGWHSHSYPVSYEWEKGRFPEPERFVKKMADNGFRINLWEHPFVSPESELYAELEGLSGSHTVWGIAPDYSLPEAANLYKKQHDEQHVNIGVSGYKLDECDGSELTNNSWMFPAHAQFPSGLDGEQMRQTYGLMFQKMTADLFRGHNRRTYGLVRASGGAASTMPYVLYSDLYDHKQFIRALCTSSFSGLLWTPEVRRARNAEDWVRRMQTVCFSPLAMLNAWGDGTKPWSFPEVEGIVRHYIKLRMRLLPYLYTAFAKYREQGIPAFRAMPFVMSPEEIAEAEIRGVSEADIQVLNTTDAAYGKKRVREWDDQYMVGDALLVAPLVEGETEREILLPTGIWYAFETGERYTGGCVIRIQAGWERIPIFVKSGSIIPMMPALSHVPPQGMQVPLELVHFGTEAGEGHLYDDDGETFDYEDGTCAWFKGIVKLNPEGTFTGELLGSSEGLRSYNEISWRFAQTRLEIKDM